MESSHRSHYYLHLCFFFCDIWKYFLLRKGLLFQSYLSTYLTSTWKNKKAWCSTKTNNHETFFPAPKHLTTNNIWLLLPFPPPGCGVTVWKAERGADLVLGRWREVSLSTDWRRYMGGGCWALDRDLLTGEVSRILSTNTDASVHTLNLWSPPDHILNDQFLTENATC